MEASIAETGTLSNESDEALAARAAHDFDAFVELYHRYLCPIYRFMRSQTRDDATAEDLTAHVFFKALSAAGTFRGDGSYKSWIFRVAHNTLMTHRTRRGRMVEVEQVPDIPDPTPGPVAQVMTQDARGLVWRTVSALPPAQREVVALHYLEDRSIEEVAGVVGRSRGAVRIMLHRARQRLRKALEHEGLA